MDSPVRLVTTSSELKQYISGIGSCNEFSIDLEFDKNFYRFGFNLCLVQIYDGSDCYLIDPLSPDLDIKLLFPILEDPSIQKVCFSFDEDLRLLHSLGCFPKNLYDLDTVAKLLNYPAMSLDNLLKEVLGIDTGSSSQQSNWYKRPLSGKQTEYAANDVLHLLRLKQRFEKEIGKNGVQDWIRQENRMLDKLDYSTVNNNEILKEKEKKKFNEVEWHIYKKLVYWRHELARMFDKPDFQILTKDLLQTLAKNPEAPVNLTNTRGVYRKIKIPEYDHRLRQLLDEAINETRNLNLSHHKPANKPPDAEEYEQMIRQRKKVSRLKKNFFKPVKSRIGELYGQETASFILSNRIIGEIVTGNNGRIADYKKELILKCARELQLDTDLLSECPGF